MAEVVTAEIPGTNGRYSVSRDGRVFSGEDELKPQVHTSGHLKVAIRRYDKPRRYYYIHRLMMESFTDGSGELVRHLDGNPKNNNIENLAWGDKSSNARDSVLHGTNFQASKTHCIRGHKFVKENLVPSKLVKGHRNCLSCNLARGKNKGKSDIIYERILNGARADKGL